MPSHVFQSLPPAWLTRNPCLRKKKIFEWCFKYLSIGILKDLSIGILKDPSIGILKESFDWHYGQAFDWNYVKAISTGMSTMSFDLHEQHLLIGLLAEHFDWNPSIDIWARPIRRVRRESIRKRQIRTSRRAWPESIRNPKASRFIQGTRMLQKRK